MARGLSVCLALLALAVQGDHGSEVVQRKERQVNGLAPFPRIGRSGGDVAWTLGSPDLQEVKRQGLMAFPRVGRGGHYGYMVVRGPGRRDTGGDGSGMWFGPRLGRRDRRSADPAAPWALVALREYPSLRRHDGYYHHADDASPDDEDDSTGGDDEAFDGASLPSRDQAVSS